MGKEYRCFYYFYGNFSILSHRLNLLWTSTNILPPILAKSVQSFGSYAIIYILAIIFFIYIDRYSRLTLPYITIAEYCAFGPVSQTVNRMKNYLTHNLYSSIPTYIDVNNIGVMETMISAKKKVLFKL